MEEEKRKLIKFSNYSLCVTLPKSVVTKLKWKKGDIVRVLIDEKARKITFSEDNSSKEISKTRENIPKKQISSKDKKQKARW